MAPGGSNGSSWRASPHHLPARPPSLLLLLLIHEGVAAVLRQRWPLLLLLSLVILLGGQPSLVNAQQPSTDGFLSIDCGNPDDYTDPTTNISYLSDNNFIDTGVSYNISEAYHGVSSIWRQSLNLRSFPDGTRNCYRIPNSSVPSGTDRCIIRATFMYGDYNRSRLISASNPIIFDLYIGVNLWRKVRLINASIEYIYEMAYVPVRASPYIWICLVNIGSGTPFISTLEMRPVPITYFSCAMNSTFTCSYVRYYYGGSTRVRFPDDIYDRIWQPYPLASSWRVISTNALISGYGEDEGSLIVPQKLLQTQVTPKDPNGALNFFNMVPESEDDFRVPRVGYDNTCWLFFHNPEYTNLTAIQAVRQFEFYANDRPLPGITPVGYRNDVVVNPVQVNQSSIYNYSFVPTSNSTLPPIISALVLMAAMNLVLNATSPTDVQAVMTIKQRYGVVKNWNGDPCYPMIYTREGLGPCQYDGTQATITSLNLSHSNLSGSLEDYYSDFQQLTMLDLSNNNFNGSIPENFLSHILSNLLVLDLSHNNFIGGVPQTILVRARMGLLTLKVDCINNAEYCTDTTTQPSKSGLSQNVVIAIASCVGGVVVLCLVVIIIWLSRKVTFGHHRMLQLEAMTKLFEYKQLQNITKDFTQLIGRGGFGSVYRGILDNGDEVAVKLCTEESPQGNKQFRAEANSLMKVHHRNLVSLVGYCADKSHLALVYEYMAQGSLSEHLRGSRAAATLLSWPIRLRIAFEAAQGLDYLQTGCGIVHRDVKSANILLDQDLHAKVADFGLAKILAVGNTTTQYSSYIVISGTPGYIDPEYQVTGVVTDKIDVYSFGVVMLEIVTGKPAIIQYGGSLIEYVEERFRKGSLELLVDPAIHGKFGENTVRKVIELSTEEHKEGGRGAPEHDSSGS